MSAPAPTPLCGRCRKKILRFPSASNEVMRFFSLKCGRFSRRVFLFFHRLQSLAARAGPWFHISLLVCYPLSAFLSRRLSESGRTPAQSSAQGTKIAGNPCSQREVLRKPYTNNQSKARIFYYASAYSTFRWCRKKFLRFPSAKDKVIRFLNISNLNSRYFSLILPYIPVFCFVQRYVKIVTRRGATLKNSAFIPQEPTQKAP